MHFTDRTLCSNKNTWCVYKLLIILFIAMETYKELIIYYLVDKIIRY